MPGIQPECFILRDRNLKRQDSMLNVYQYLKERFAGKLSIFSPASDSLIRKGTELHDFMDGSFNDGARGLLIAGGAVFLHVLFAEF